jgi:predicted HicB family RNase H-like nuclease
MARPPKRPGQARDKLLQVRVQECEYVSFKEAAEQSGLDLSAWVRERLRQAARKELAELGQPIAFGEEQKRT